MPKRIQRRRTKGWEMPPNTVYVGRPTKWGNPFRVGSEYEGDDGSMCIVFDVAHSLECYRARMDQLGELFGLKDFLAGKNLCCWCNLDEPCHADVLLEIANR